MTARYGIYFTPDDNSELAAYGATVLRRTAVDASDWLNPDLAVSFPATSAWQEQIRKPAHYGFHATMKAPFELAQGQSADKLTAALEAFCRTQISIVLDGLAPVRSCRYDALALTQQPDEISRLASDCVTLFEQFRAPLGKADIARRNPASLTESELANMHRYGYPYVLNDFNFHMTLSGQSNRDDNAYFAWLQDLYKTMVKEPPVLDRLCVFYQPDRQKPFIRIEEFKFGRGVM